MLDEETREDGGNNIQISDPHEFCQAMLKHHLSMMYSIKIVVTLFMSLDNAKDHVHCPLRVSAVAEESQDLYARRPVNSMCSFGLHPCSPASI